MIARVWQGVVPAAREAAYRELLAREVLPEYRRTPGNRGVTVLRRQEGERVRFLVLTQWESLDAIRAFAGDDVERAVFYPEDDRFLVERDLAVTHHRVDQLHV